MLEPRWTYHNARGLTKCYAHVDYYGRHVIGQWFALDADTGAERWSRKFFRPNTISGVEHDVIVASELRSDGPVTGAYGIYGIDARTGDLLWVNHAGGFLGKLFRCFDYVPGFTNELRDVASSVVDEHVICASGRILDIHSGKECPSVKINAIANTDKASAADEEVLYAKKSLEVGGDTISVHEPRDDFVIMRRDSNGREAWKFSAKERSLHVEGNYYGYRLHDGHIFIILGDAPKYVPIKMNEPLYVKSNPANYQMGILDTSSGECRLVALANAQRRNECRIEAIRDSRILVSCDERELVEYQIQRSERS